MVSLKKMPRENHEMFKRLLNFICSVLILGFFPNFALSSELEHTIQFSKQYEVPGADFMSSSIKVRLTEKLRAPIPSSIPAQVILGIKDDKVLVGSRSMPEGIKLEILRWMAQNMFKNQIAFSYVFDGLVSSYKNTNQKPVNYKVLISFDEIKLIDAFMNYLKKNSSLDKDSIMYKHLISDLRIELKKTVKRYVFKTNKDVLSQVSEKQVNLLTDKEFRNLVSQKVAENTIHSNLKSELKGSVSNETLIEIGHVASEIIENLPKDYSSYKNSNNLILRDVSTAQKLWAFNIAFMAIAVSGVTFGGSPSLIEHIMAGASVVLFLRTLKNLPPSEFVNLVKRMKLDYKEKLVNHKVVKDLGRFCRDMASSSH